MARDKKLPEIIIEDYTKAALSPRERIIADFTVKVTCCVKVCSPDDIEKLKGEGLTERDIVSLVEIIAYYNMSTRIFESLSTRM